MMNAATGAVLAAALACCALPLAGLAEEAKTPALPNPFYAMDTAFMRGSGRKTIELFDLVSKLGYAGFAWHECPPDQAKAILAEAEQAKLKMFAIYCSAQVTPKGELAVHAKLPDLIAALKGSGTIIWLHVGGNGPAFASLKGDEPLVKTLRGLSDTAAANGLRIAIYPHVGEWTARFADATRLAQVVKHPQFGVTFNLCHAMAMGEEQAIPKLLDDAKAVLFIVSICGADTGVTGGNWGKLIQTLDKGTFNQLALLKKLRAIGFAGPIGFQGYGIKGSAEGILTPTIAAWRKLSAAAAAQE
ncbi:MAG: TIM barrel protein [Planctomycetes bacterium]|nr:TIM barrel protein [Planctomycetota bacterium]